jgi:hypothetical protein
MASHWYRSSLEKNEMKAKYPLKNLIKILITALVLVSLHIPSALACEIEVGIQGDEKSEYQVGDSVILEIQVFLTHRNCPEGIDATKYKLEGLKALGATKWIEVSDSTFVRKIKVEITGKEKAVLHVVRTCDKEGGYGIYTFTLAQ